MEENIQLKGNKQQFFPKPYQQKKYYTPNDVKVHNTANDCWVTFFHQVFDITPLIQENIESPHCQPLIEAAGTDITYWFDSKFDDPSQITPRKYVDQSGLEACYCPKGHYLHVPPPGPNSTFDAISHSTPWWRNQEYFIGCLTQKVRKIKIYNMLTDHEDVIEVPSEETINQILERYKEINFHAASYTWKRLGKPLDMEQTLYQNGIIDEDEDFERLQIPEHEWYIPIIHLYFNDDLSVA